MLLRRKHLNISLIILALILGGMAVWIYRQPPLIYIPEPAEAADTPSEPDTTGAPAAAHEIPAADSGQASTPVTSDKERGLTHVKTTNFKDIEPRAMVADHPFRLEAIKLLSGRLEETDSASRHKILSYCEHLRTSYTTRDIDFIRQVFSDNALIIVGHVVKSGARLDSTMYNGSKVKYTIRSKQAYLANLERVFKTNKKIDVDFSDFRIMRHPTVDGLYGVTLRQKYKSDAYGDDGYLFLLWDFRNPSMPLIHVRTWQPSLSAGPDGDELIDISDFNLE